MERILNLVFAEEFNDTGQRCGVPCNDCDVGKRFIELGLQTQLYSMRAWVIMTTDTVSELLS